MTISHVLVLTERTNSSDSWRSYWWWWQRKLQDTLKKIDIRNHSWNWLNHWKSVSEWVSQRVSQRVSESVRKLVSQSASESVSQSVREPANESVNKSARQPIHGTDFSLLCFQLPSLIKFIPVLFVRILPLSHGYQRHVCWSTSAYLQTVQKNYYRIEKSNLEGN